MSTPCMAPRDLKDITDLVSRKLEMYLNIDERERRFDPEGCYRVSPRMHKYDVMYRLLESTEFEKSLHKASRTPRSRSRTGQSPAKNSDKSRSRSKSAKTPRNQQSKDTKTRPKSSVPVDNKVKSKQKQTVEKTQENKSSKDRFKYRPIAIKTPRTANTMVGNKQTKRLEKYANEVFENHPVKDLQKLHSVSPRIPNNGKLQNYSCHVGAALNTKHYMDFYMKTGLDGHKNSPRRETRAITDKGSVSPAASDRRSRDTNDGPHSPETDSSRAVVTFQSPASSAPSESNYKVINSRHEPKHANSSSSSTDNVSEPAAEILPDLDGTSPELGYYQELNGISPEPILDSLPAQSTIIDTANQDRSRCKSRIGRKSSSLNVNYNSESDDQSSSQANSENNDNTSLTASTSTRTNSPHSTQESLVTPSSYQEADSSDSSNSSVLRYYELSTGEIYSPWKQKSKKEKHEVIVKDSHREEMNYKLAPRKSPERRRRGNQNPRQQPDLQDSSCSSESDTPRYTLLRPSSRLLKRSSVRSNSMTENSSDSPRSSTPLVIQKTHRPKSVKKSKQKQLIDLNLTAVLKRGRSEMSMEGSGDDDVFIEEGDKDEDEEMVKRASDCVTSDSMPSRGGCDESDREFRKAVSREEYYMLDSPRINKEMSPDKLWSQTPPLTASPRVVLSASLIPQGISPIEARQEFTKSSTAETPPLLEPIDKNVTFNTNDQFYEPELQEMRGEMQAPCEKDLDVVPNSTEPVTQEETYTHQETGGDTSLAEQTDDSIKGSSSLSSSDGRQSGSEVEYLSRGSDGNGKDGRGNSRRRSATRRPPSRGSQWEDEIYKSGTSTPKYHLGADSGPDERGYYEYLPEHRGIYTEKGCDDGPEYYIITEFVEYDPKTILVNDTEPTCGIPPKSRPRTATINTQPGKSSPQSRGETGTPGSSEYRTQAEIYKAVSSLKEIQIDLNPESHPRSEGTITSTPSEDLQHFNFLPDASSNSSESIRGSAVLATQIRDSDVPILIKPYQDPSELETALVFDMEEQPEEYRGRADAENIQSSPGTDDQENVLDRGLSRASSVTSTLSWNDKYGAKTEKDPHSSLPQKSDNDVLKNSDTGTKQQDSKTVTSQEDVTCFKVFPEESTHQLNQPLDEDLFDDLKKFYIRSKDEECDQELEDKKPEVNTDDLMKQLEKLVKAKKMHIEKVADLFSEESGSSRGTETGMDCQPQKKFILKPQYSSLIHDLIQTYPRLSSSSSSGSSSDSSCRSSSSGSSSSSSGSTPAEPETTSYVPDTTKTATPSTNQVDDDLILVSSDTPMPETVEDHKLNLQHSSYLQTPLGISGEVTECVQPSQPDSKPKSNKAALTKKDITVLKTPCVVVGKPISQTEDHEKRPRPSTGKKKVNKQVLERGQLEVKSQRPRSAATVSRRKKSSLNLYFSA